MLGCWGHMFPLPCSYSTHRLLGAEVRTQLPMSGFQEWYSRFPSSQAHLIFRIIDLGTRVSSSLPFPVARDQRYPNYISVLPQLSGNHGNGRSDTKESGTTTTKEGFSRHELHPLLYLVCLLPAASLGVHVYCIFCPVSLNVEFLSNLWVRDTD